MKASLTFVITIDSKNENIDEEEKTKFPLFGKHYIEDMSSSKNLMYFTAQQQYNSEKHVMVRIISPIKFPVDWKSRTIDRDMIDEINKKEKAKNPSIHSATSKSININTNYDEELPTVSNTSWWCLPVFGSIAHASIRSETLDKVELSIKVDAIMIHIHGGGFIATSSFSHQSYTRKWAKELGIPIFSIDYRLAPEYPYPAALNDVWQAYYWIVNNCQSHFGIRPEKIFIAGDSAGGNLTLALTMLAIEKHFRVPDLILPSYPALNLSMRNFSPSLILSLDDYILPSAFLMLCLDSYVKDACPEEDYYLSPSICPDSVMKLMPPTRILIAGNDPLRDEIYKFWLRLLRNKVNIKVKEYISFPHGFLSFELPIGGIDECSKCNEQAIEYFKEFLPQHEEQQSK